MLIVQHFEITLIIIVWYCYNIKALILEFFVHPHVVYLKIVIEIFKHLVDMYW
jgi:hypothetical protein